MADDDDVFKGAYESAGVLGCVKSESMDLNNDPRFFHVNVLEKRLTAFKTLSVVAVLMVNLSVGQMFKLSKKGNVTWIQYSGFVSMTVVFLLDLITVIVIVQQLFQTYRLMTTGATGFDVAKSYYLNPSIVSMRHNSVRGFFFSLPLFMASTSAMIYSAFKPHQKHLSIPVVVLLLVVSVILACVNEKHRSIFKQKYELAKQWEAPLASHLESLSNRSRPKTDSSRWEWMTDV